MKIFVMFQKLLTRFHFSKLFRENKKLSRKDWSLIRTFFQRANLIYLGPTGYSPVYSFEYKVVLHLEENYFEFRELLFDSLFDESPVLVGYCLLIIDSSGELNFKSVPQEVLHRKDEITWELAKRGGRQELGEFAKDLILNSLERNQ